MVFAGSIVLLIGWYPPWPGTSGKNATARTSPGVGLREAGRRGTQSYRRASVEYSPPMERDSLRAKGEGRVAQTGECGAPGLGAKSTLTLRRSSLRHESVREGRATEGFLFNIRHRCLFAQGGHSFRRISLA